MPTPSVYTPLYYNLHSYYSWNDFLFIPPLSTGMVGTFVLVVIHSTPLPLEILFLIPSQRFLHNCQCWTDLAFTTTATQLLFYLKGELKRIMPNTGKYQSISWRESQRWHFKKVSFVLYFFVCLQRPFLIQDFIIKFIFVPHIPSFLCCVLSAPKAVLLHNKFHVYSSL